MSAAPIPMVLHCPTCFAQHIDEATETWANPPHRSHLCHNCGCIWRPADVATVGVRAVETRGSADTWPNDTPVPDAVGEGMQKTATVRALILHLAALAGEHGHDCPVFIVDADTGWKLPLHPVQTRHHQDIHEGPSVHEPRAGILIASLDYHGEYDDAQE